MKNKLKLLFPSDFEDTRPPYSEFALYVDVLSIGQIEWTKQVIPAHYDKHMNLQFNFQDNEGKNVFGNDYVEATLSGNDFPEDISLLISEQNMKSSSEVSYTFIPKREPLLLSFTQSATRVEAVLMNGPEILWSNMEINFMRDDYEISMREFQSTKELRKNNMRLNREYVATGIVTLKHKNGAEITPENSLELLSHFDRFLTFVKGAHCGIGNIVGTTQTNKTAFAYLGFLRMDQFKVATGWCDMGVVKTLPDLYQSYSKSMSEENDKQALLTTIGFYRASNITKEASSEMALVASHAALETIVPHILKFRGGWSDNLLKNRDISFSDKLRAACSFIELADDPFNNLPEIKKKSKSLGDIDPYKLISLFRNRIVHQGKVFKYTGRELLEVWHLSQWLVEILLFYWFGHRGEMNDRREYQGWRGAPIKSIPLPKTPELH